MSRALAMVIAVAFALLYFYSKRVPTGTIEGTVRNRFGAPIANVHVGIVGLAHSGLSDTAGWYRLANVPVRTHSLRATVVGYTPRERDSVVVRTGVTTRVDFTLDRNPDLISTSYAVDGERPCDHDGPGHGPGGVESD